MAVSPGILVEISVKTAANGLSLGACCFFSGGGGYSGGLEIERVIVFFGRVRGLDGSGPSPDPGPQAMGHVIGQGRRDAR